MNKIFSKNELKLFKKVIFILNVILLFFNIYVYNNREIVINFKSNLFKYSDYFIMNLNMKAYKYISKYLTNKYNINFESSKSSLFNRIKKKIIKIKSIGLFDRKHHIKWLKNKLDDEFILQFDEDNPDYLIYNVFTDEDSKSKYKNAIKIAIYTENVMPDLNLADYTIGHYLFR